MKNEILMAGAIFALFAYLLITASSISVSAEVSTSRFDIELQR
jgi:hypothetical protein